MDVSCVHFQFLDASRLCYFQDLLLHHVALGKKSSHHFHSPAKLLFVDSKKFSKKSSVIKKKRAYKIIQNLNSAKRRCCKWVLLLQPLASRKISTSWPLALDLVVHANLSPVAPLVRGRRGRACQGAAVHVLGCSWRWRSISHFGLGPSPTYVHPKNCSS